MDWHYAENGQQLGPVTEQRLLELAQNGTVNAQTLVWHSGMQEWKPFHEVGPGTPPPIPQAPSGPTRTCTSCARNYAVSDLAIFGDAAICADCKPGWVQRLRQGMVSSTGAQRYGGFWIRLGAQGIDWIIFLFVEMIFLSGPFTTFFQSAVREAANGRQVPPEQVFQFYRALGPAWLLLMLFHVAYTVFFTVRFGATPGKMACGLKIIDAGGDKVSIGQAFGRYFGTWLSGMILNVGYLMAAWDSEKRALHDRMAGTRVIRTR